MPQIIQGRGMRWVVVVVYALAMAWLEAAVVLYLRTIDGHMDPYHPLPLRSLDTLAKAELVREAATLIMLAAVGWLAGQTWRSRIGYSLVAFGIWDIFYYVFLIPLTGWPRSSLDWDILFLLPLPWWGPVLAPMLIAGFMIAGGSLVAFRDDATRPLWPAKPAVVLGSVGVILGLYVFMADSLKVAGQGSEALQKVMPQQFNWPLFLLALAFMAAPLIDLIRQVSGRTPGRPMSPAQAAQPQPSAPKLYE